MSCFRMIMIALIALIIGVSFDGFIRDTVLVKPAFGTQQETNQANATLQPGQRNEILEQIKKQGLIEYMADMASRLEKLETVSPLVGTVMAYSAEWPPKKTGAGNWTEDELGWMLCDGRTFDQVKYPALYVVLRSNSLPDFRGYFLRGLDVSPFAGADIRISFQGKEMCSAVGTESLRYTSQFEARPKVGRDRENNPIQAGGNHTLVESPISMYLGNLEKYPEEAIRGHVLHEFGHALGLQHEHQNPDARFKWNKDFIYKYCKDQYGWDTAKVDMNILNSLNGNISNSQYDSESVMLYHFPAEWTLDGKSTPFNTGLSEKDKIEIAKLYPK